MAFARESFDRFALSLADEHVRLGFAGEPAASVDRQLRAKHVGHAQALGRGLDQVPRRGAEYESLTAVAPVSVRCRNWRRVVCMAVPPGLKMRSKAGCILNGSARFCARQSPLRGRPRAADSRLVSPMRPTTMKLE